MSGIAAASSPPPGGHDVRPVLRVALVLSLLLVVYGSLVPLDFVPQEWARVVGALQALQWPVADALSRTDMAVNLLLMVPVAFLWRALLPGGRSWLIESILAVGIWLCCLLLSLGVEFAQFYFPARTPSLGDVAAQSAGAVVGLLAHRLAGRAVLQWLQGWWAQESGQPFALRLLHGWLVVLLLFSMMPLDLSISPAELYQKFKDGRVNLLPFTDLPREPAELVYAVLTDIALWLPVGALWALLGRTVPQVLWRGLLLSAAVELVQVLVISRVSSSTDVLSGALGCAIGALLLAATSARRGAAPGQDRGAAWLLACLAWAMVMLAAFWFPFDIDASPEGVQGRWRAAQQLPFVGYFAGGEFHSMNEMVRKPLMFLPLGLLWAGHVAHRGVWHRRGLVRLGLCICALMAVLVEGGQLLLVAKVADFTDLALECLGGCAGLLLGLRLWGLWSAPVQADPAVAAPPVVQAVALSPAAGPSRSAGRWWLQELLVLLVLTGAAWSLAQHPGAPYNLRELFPRTPLGLVGTLAVVAVAWWLLALPLQQYRLWLAAPWRANGLLVWLPLAGLPAGLALLLFVPQDSLADIVGSPVWGGPGWLETLLRYQALHAALALAATGAAWLVARLALGRAASLLPRWVMTLLLWALPLHALVVTWAATDNLVELMRGGGGLLASLLLFSGLLCLLAMASALAAVAAGLPHRARLLVLAAMAWPLGTAALWHGSEHLLYKYDKVFSAAQFILSTDRNHYAALPDLWLRYALACLALVALSALLQSAGWRRLKQAPGALAPASRAPSLP
ncbi:MAG: VanZ family protein [Aquabacterium sp.]|nr:VanZ family protein [Aquabacterium sp.]